MTTKNVTITSKNQVTLPAEYVRSLGLEKGRRLTIRRHGTKLILQPEPSLQETLQAVREEFKRLHPDFKPLSDAEWREASGVAFAERWKQLEDEGRV